MSDRRYLSEGFDGEARHIDGGNGDTKDVGTEEQRAASVPTGSRRSRPSRRGRLVRSATTSFPSILSSSHVRSKPDRWRMT